MAQPMSIKYFWLTDSDVLVKKRKKDTWFYKITNKFSLASLLIITQVY